MPDSTLEGLPPNGTLSGTDTIYLVQPGGSRELTLADLAAWIKTEESIVPANLPHRGARVIRNTAATGLTFPVIVTWQAEDFDTDGFWSVGDPTKLIVPAGISKIRLCGQVSFEPMTAAGSLFVAIRKNGTGTTAAYLDGMSKDAPRFDSTAGFTTNVAHVFSGVMDVVEGDYFDLRVNAAMATQDQIMGDVGDTWFEIEVVETI